MTKSSVFPYFLSALPLPNCFATEQNTVEASLFVLVKNPIISQAFGWIFKPNFILQLTPVFHVSVHLLTIKISQWARENLCCYRKIFDILIPARPVSAQNGVIFNVSGNFTLFQT